MKCVPPGVWPGCACRFENIGGGVFTTQHVIGTFTTVYWATPCDVDGDNDPGEAC